MRRRWWIVLGLVVVLVSLAYAGWRVNQVRTDLTAAQSRAHELKAALTGGDRAGADQALAGLRAHSASAAEITGGPLWSTLGVLPFFGDDADGVRTVSHVLADLSDGGIDPLVKSAGSLHTGAFTPSNGTVDVQAIRQIAAPMSASQGAFADADDALSAVDSSGFVDVLGSAYDDLAGQVHSAATGMAAATTASGVLPGMLGEDGPRDYLLIFQNNAELRSTGGLPGAAALVSVDHGKVELKRQVSVGDIGGELDKPVLPLTEEERFLFGDQVGTYFQDANFTPDFPRTAELMAARWKLAFGQRLDGVLSVDPVALSYLLEGTGPVTVDGVELTKENAVEQLLNRPYVEIEDPEAQNAFFALAAKTVFDKFSSGAGSPQALLSALARGAKERRLLVHSFDPAEQEKLAGTIVAGELLSDGDGPRAGAYLNDGTGSKMSYYLDYDVDVRATGCRDATQKYAGTIDLHSDTPEGVATFPPSVTGLGDDVVPKGNQFLAIHLYAPVGGSFDGVFIDGDELDVQLADHRGHQVASLALFLEPGQRRELTYRMTGGQGGVGDTDIIVTPGTAQENESSVVASAC